MDPPELASEPPRSCIGAASNSARAFKTFGLGNVRVSGVAFKVQHIAHKLITCHLCSQYNKMLTCPMRRKYYIKFNFYLIENR